MQRLLCALLAAFLLTFGLSVSASAELVEIGEMDDASPAPSCPTDPCLTLARVTAFQKRVAGEQDLYTVPSNGRIVAWTVRLSEPNAEQIEFFEGSAGGAPQANITVFRMGKKKKNRGIGKNVGQSGVQELEGYYGQTVQFPMVNSIRVRKGDRVALTTPTWAPVLAAGLEDNYVWRATRDADACNDKERFFDPKAITDLGTETPFPCGYKSGRLTYSVTLVTAPKPSKPATDDEEEDAEDARANRRGKAVSAARSGGVRP